MAFSAKLAFLLFVVLTNTFFQMGMINCEENDSPKVVMREEIVDVIEEREGAKSVRLPYYWSIIERLRKPAAACHATKCLDHGDCVDVGCESCLIPRRICKAY